MRVRAVAGATRERGGDAREGDELVATADAGDQSGREGRPRDKVLVEWEYFRLRLWSV